MLELIKIISIGAVLLGVLLITLAFIFAIFQTDPIFAILFGLVAGGALAFVISLFIETIF